jgi:peptidoglycan/xylan/chitin deacetylase (PgdA/CDA1 family)
MSDSFVPPNKHSQRNRGIVFFLGIGLVLSLLVSFIWVEPLSGADQTFYVKYRHEASPPLIPKLFPQTAASNFSATRTPVLMYHYIRTVVNPGGDPLGFSLSVTPQDFETQISYLQQNGYNSITPDQLFQALAGKALLPARAVLLTFDDGYEDFYTTAFPILKKYNFKATVFVVPGFVGEPDGRYLTWQQVKELDASGLITVGAHTMHHVNLVTHPDAPAEISQSKEVLESFLKKSVTAFAYPGGTYDEHVINLVAESGYDLAFTTRFGIWHDLSQRLALSRVRISGGLTMEKFVERLNGQLNILTKAQTVAIP